MSGPLRRVGALFFDTAEPAAPPPASLPAASSPLPAPAPTRAVVLGAAAVVLPVAAACAGELRARARAVAAVVCIWMPPGAASQVEEEAPAARSPAGATTPGARRLAARLTAAGLKATACGRLAWLALDPDPSAAAGEFARCGSVADVPLVLAVAGARPEAFEGLLADADVCLAVLPADSDPTLRELALALLPVRERAVVAPLPAGPPRWAAMAGLARMRSLPGSRP